jgi:predicted TIM-barrel fold metal-dependent hydrolase
MPRDSSKPRIARRDFFKAAGIATALTSSRVTAQATKPFIVDCQSHLFFPEVLDMMRKRKSGPVVFDKDGTTFLKMGDWLRKVPPMYLDVETKIAAMDANGIDITMLSTNDPGPECFGEDGVAVAQLIHDSLAQVIAKHPTRFRGLCTLPLQDEKAASEELDRCINQLGFRGILLYTNLDGAWCEMNRHSAGCMRARRNWASLSCFTRRSR